MAGRTWKGKRLRKSCGCHFARALRFAKTNEKSGWTTWIAAEPVSDRRRDIPGRESLQKEVNREHDEDRDRGTGEGAGRPGLSPATYSSRLLDVAD
jgi:hypothetical protein